MKRRKWWKPAFFPFPKIFSTLPEKKIQFLSRTYSVICKCSISHTVPTSSHLKKPIFFSKHYGKRRKCWSSTVSPFSSMFSTQPQTNLIIQVINHIPSKPWFLRLQYKSAENTVGKGEIDSYEKFLLFPVFSTHLENVPPFSPNSKSLSSNSFSLDKSEILLFQRGLTLSRKTNFRLVQTERFCRRQFQIQWEWQKSLWMGRKHRGKRRNCSFRAISSFPTVFSKDFYCRHVKTRACLGKGLLPPTWTMLRCCCW